MSSFSPVEHLKVSLDRPLTHPGSYGRIKVQGSSHGFLEISLRRTIRVPDNDKSYSLPPDCGAFPLYSVSDHEDKFPSDLAAKGGVFLPIHQREALWVNFRSTRPFAVKVYVGGVNAVSGESKTLDSKRGKSAQDYVVPPKQQWLDGIARADGQVSQFVAATVGSGYSVEAQVTGQDSVCGMQFEIVPRKPNVQEEGGATSVEVRVKTLTGNTLLITMSLSYTVEDLRNEIWGRQGIPEGHQRLIHNGRQMENQCPLSFYEIDQDPVIHLVLGGRSLSEEELAARATAEAKSKLMRELAIVPGGFIQQTIVEDNLSPENWDAAHDHGYPFFKFYEDPSDISGSFGVKSIGTLDKKAGINVKEHMLEKVVSFCDVVIRGKRWEKATSTPVSLNGRDPISVFLPFRLRQDMEK